MLVSIITIIGYLSNKIKIILNSINLFNKDQKSIMIILYKDKNIIILN